MKIEIAAFRPFSKNTLKGFLTIRLPEAGLVLKECTWHEKGGKEWVGFPARQFQGADGEKKWANLIEFIEGYDSLAWQDAALKAIYEHVASNPA